MMADWLLPAVCAVRNGAQRLIDSRTDAEGVTARDDMLAGRPVRHFVPERVQPGCAMLYFHGGGFITGGLDSHHGLCSRLALHLAMPLVMASYRLAPEHPAPAQLDDALAVTRAMAASSDQLLIGGDSAGAWLALRCALDLHQTAPGRIDAALLLYPFVDLAAQPDTLLRYAKPAVALMRAALGQNYPSLLTFDLAAAPPSALLWGAGFDPVAPGAAALAGGLTAAGVQTMVRQHRLLVHGGLNLANRLGRVDRILAGAAADVRALARLP